jgi:DNA-binding transcriptional regulator YiaG
MINQAGRSATGGHRLRDLRAPVKASIAMTSAELSDILREIGWQPAELATRLGVRQESVRGWLSGRREIPENLAVWLRAVRDGVSSAGPLPEGWR